MVDYNVLRPEREPLIARAAAAGKGVLAGMALAMGHTGLQVAKLRGPQDLWYAARGLARHRAEVAKGARFGFLGRARGHDRAPRPRSPTSWPTRTSPAPSSARPGSATCSENLAASGLALPADVMARIRQG